MNKEKKETFIPSRTSSLFDFWLRTKLGSQVGTKLQMTDENSTEKIRKMCIFYGLKNKENTVLCTRIMKNE